MTLEQAKELLKTATVPKTKEEEEQIKLAIKIVAGSFGILG